VDSLVFYVLFLSCSLRIYQEDCVDKIHTCSHITKETMLGMFSEMTKVLIIQILLEEFGERSDKLKSSRVCGTLQRHNMNYNYNFCFTKVQHTNVCCNVIY